MPKCSALHTILSKRPTLLKSLQLLRSPMVDVLYENWEPIIGLEIHVQLNTRTKMFGSEPYQFGNEPNTDIGVISTGQPGSLPVVNREAVRKAVQFGCAIH